VPSQRVEDDLPSYMDHPLVRAVAASILARAGARREARRNASTEEPDRPVRTTARRGRRRPTQPDSPERERPALTHDPVSSDDIDSESSERESVRRIRDDHR
jgi:hypothetical protein